MRNLIKNTEGATAIEYGLLAALIAVAIIYAIGAIGDALTRADNSVASKLPNGKPVAEKPIYGND